MGAYATVTVDNVRISNVDGRGTIEIEEIDQAGRLVLSGVLVKVFQQELCDTFNALQKGRISRPWGCIRFKRKGECESSGERLWLEDYYPKTPQLVFSLVHCDELEPAQSVCLNTLQTLGGILDALEFLSLDPDPDTLPHFSEAVNPCGAGGRPDCPSLIQGIGS